MSRSKRIPRLGWLVVGIAVAVLLMPSSVAVAKAGLKFTGIQGTSGNQADVSSAGQLLTTAASPSSSFETRDVILHTTSGAIVTPPAGDALVITSIENDVYNLTASGPGDGLAVFVSTSACSTSNILSYYHGINPPTVGEFDLAFNPGIVVPNGDALCGFLASSAVEDESTAVGYAIPAADAQAETPHGVPPTQQ